ncbi:SET and MYND domain-containing protein 4-like [Diaphorina citri]|uniref:SET and MYND domain-containing protein 4-like n=1 Tax=Diaphorina citri TaxID=121845 RepID=A0A3Q0IVJ0_DIACI|nr:SET and MYND domain-containing protein 4-like [Diaphorina citri]
MAKASAVSVSSSNEVDYGFCHFDGMQHVSKELKWTSDSLYKKLSTLQTPEEKFKFLFSLLEQVKFPARITYSKSEKASLQLRKKGNNYYVSGDKKTALEYYTMSLCMAPDRSKVQAMAVANKSACFYDMDHPRASATHIKIVLTCMQDEYPQELTKKLYIRMESIINKLLPRDTPEFIVMSVLCGFFECGTAQFRNSPFIIQPILDFGAFSTESFTQIPIVVAHGRNTKIPAMSSAVRLQYSETLGRHLVAGRNIEAGDVLMRDTMLSMALYTEKYEWSHCSHCLRFVSQLVPCPFCPHESFCDEVCRQAAEEKYHWALCNSRAALNFGTNLSHTKMMLALRLLVSFLSKHRGALYEFMLEVSKYESEIAGNKNYVQGVNKNGVYDQNDFRTVYFMYSKPDLLSEDMKKSLAINCAYAIEAISQSDDFFHMEVNLTPAKKAELKIFLTSLLYRILVGLEWNCFEVFEHLSYVARKLDVDEPFILKTQLTIPYFDYWSTPRETKAQLFRELGGFQCTCVACKSSWDTDVTQSSLSFSDLTLSPRCASCKQSKQVRPDKDIMRCGKCKLVVEVNKIRARVQTY